MKKMVYFIEYEWKNKWEIASSYDYSYFTTYEDAKKFVEKNRDAIPDSKIRIVSYELSEICWQGGRNECKGLVLKLFSGLASNYYLGE